ncbi:MAG: hypothetical protein A3K14_03890 [Sulfurimonas sp. RIFCSPLOWO2_12_FULL_36_74]|uniref:hypothetical protein n=1 Tax=Sulfurimonas sp. TaxID=2022749 RepID=UPI0008B6BC76|nr:hypothetical protein [Sulfurimonas sp.]OHE00915.1 MAG: hypothetical protein A3J26_02810 [Sulfurimonas sp. RIFCSPLOWO2_02_FULL_36_28]OHE06916.1 MAG: hypothetical protein A3K14_03890 [Sulfurimonas sp. RIFCSPLOWO2_12_FULL_36_74]
MEILFIIIIILAIIVVTAILSAKNKVNNLNKEKIHKNTNDDKLKIEISKSKIQIIGTIALVIIMSILIIREYREYKQEQMLMKIMYGTIDEKKIEETNNAIMKQTQKMIEETNKINDNLYKQLNKQLK